MITRSKSVTAYDTVDKDQFPQQLTTTEYCAEWSAALKAYTGGHDDYSMLVAHTEFTEAINAEDTDGLSRHKLSPCVVYYLV